MLRVSRLSQPNLTKEKNTFDMKKKENGEKVFRLSYIAIGERERNLNKPVVVISFKPDIKEPE